MSNLVKVQKSGLHDYEIADIRVDYSRAQISIKLNSPKGEKDELKIENFILFSISHEEAWGKGKYVCSSDVQLVDDDAYLLEIELNSGDKIMVKHSIDERFYHPKYES